MEQIVTTQANKVSSVIAKLLYKTQILSALVIQSNGQVSDFEQVASIVMDDPSIRNVILAPGGTVSAVYPVEGNERVLGFDYFSDSEGNQEAIDARDRGQLVLGGPFHLVQGGQALVGRLPVYIDDAAGQKQFWGLVSVTLNYPEALDGAELDQLKNQGFAFEIWRISPDTGEHQIIANSDYSYNRNAPYVQMPMELLNAQWFFRLSPIRSWYEYPETWIFLFVGCLISWLIASLVLYNRDLREMQSGLEALTYTDPLTGILNRRGMFKEIQQLLDNHLESFTVCYIDLDKFKGVNDTYGHTVGDQMLTEFARVFSRHLNERDIFARAGGDEFILILKEPHSGEDLPSFFYQLEQELRHAIQVRDDVSLDISFSVGQAVYPRDGATIDSLLAHADSDMYRSKKTSV